MDFVRLTVVRDQYEADVVCALLRANGIDARSRATDVSPEGFGGWREVLVADRDLTEARALLEAPAV